MKKTKKAQTLEEPQAPEPIRKHYQRFMPLLSGTVFLIAVFIVLTTRESEYLYRVQELSLFLDTPLFFHQQLVVAGGFLTWAGTWLTQFFYHPWIGSLFFCAWLGLLMWLFKRTFRVPDHWWPLLLIPAVLILLTNFTLGYWIYYMKLRGYFFIAAMGTSAAMALLWAYRKLAPTADNGKRLALTLGYMLLVAVLGYPIAGFYVLLAIVLMAVISWRLQLKTQWKAALTLWAVALVWLVPVIYYRQVYYQANSSDIWFQALPLLTQDDTFTLAYMPYILLAAFLLMMALLYQAAFFLRPIARKWLSVSVQGVLAIAIVGACWHFWYKDKIFYEELQMTTCVDHQDWEGVVSIMRQHEGEPTRMMVMYKTLALFKLGRAADEMYNYRDGSVKPAANLELRVAQIGGKSIYLYYGLPNYCYRWCLEDGVEYGWRTEHLKFLIRCAILNGEYVVAQKYIDLLKHTRYHAQWAAHYEQLLQGDTPQLVQADAELGPITQLMDGSDVLGSDQSLIELFLLNLQAYRTTTNPLCAELVLLSAMQLKDIPAFWRAFFQYANLHVGKPMPRHFQEAAYLYGHLEDKVDISRMPFDKNVVQSYKDFMDLAKQCQGMSNDRMKEVFYPRFGGTFYYNYFLMRNLKAY